MIVALIAAIVNVGNQNLTKLDKTTIVSAAVWAFGLHLFSIMLVIFIRSQIRKSFFVFFQLLLQITIIFISEIIIHYHK